MTLPGGAQYDRTYTADNRLDTRTNPSGSQIDLGYDAGGRVTGVATAGARAAPTSRQLHLRLRRRHRPHGVEHVVARGRRQPVARADLRRLPADLDGAQRRRHRLLRLHAVGERAGAVQVVDRRRGRAGRMDRRAATRTVSSPASATTRSPARPTGTRPSTPVRATRASSRTSPTLSELDQNRVEQSGTTAYDFDLQRNAGRARHPARRARRGRGGDRAQLQLRRRGPADHGQRRRRRDARVLRLRRGRQPHHANGDGAAQTDNATRPDRGRLRGATRSTPTAS